MLALFLLTGGKGIATVQVTQNLHCILLAAKVGKDPVKGLLDIERLHLNLVTIEGHEIRFHAKSTSLIKTAAARRGTQLADVGNIHLAKRIQVQII